MAPEKVRVIKPGTLAASHKNDHEGYEYLKYELTPRNPLSHCYAAIYEIPPKKANYPYHYHIKNEEVFYIISGQGILLTPEGEQGVGPGDVIVCPNGEAGAHKLTNCSETERLIYIDFDTVNSPEVVMYPHSKKVGVIVQGQSSQFFKEGDSVDYYEGE